MFLAGFMALHNYYEASLVFRRFGTNMLFLSLIRAMHKMDSYCGLMKECHNIATDEITCKARLTLGALFSVAEKGVLGEKSDRDHCKHPDLFHQIRHRQWVRVM